MFGSSLADVFRTPASDCRAIGCDQKPEFAITRLCSGPRAMEKAPAYPPDQAVLICGSALAPAWAQGDGDPASAMRGLLEGPVYTRPRAWREREVPEVLVSGNHAAIARWRRDMALRRTAAHRPDLIAGLRDLDRRDREVLAEAGFPVSAEDMAH